MPLVRYKGGRKVNDGRWRQRREALLAALGARCAVCGAKEGLEFDHILAEDWQPMKLSKSQRLDVYESAYAMGNLQLLCAKHHGEKTREDEPSDWIKDLNPF